MKRLFIITLALFCTACNTDWRRKYDEVYPSQNGISMVRKDNKYGLVNAEGTVVAPLKYDYINIYPSAEIPFYDVTINNLYGVIRPSGEELIPAQYNFISYSEGVFIVQLNDKKKLLSTNNETYEQAEPYTKSNEEWEDYYYILIKKGREVNIDKEGNLLSFK